MSIKYIGIETNFKRLIQIDLDLSNHCNYACTYCGPQFNGATSNWCDYKKLILFLEAVIAQYPDVNIFLQLKGGEPTQWPSLKIFLKTITKYDNIYVGIITNLSRTKRFWKDLNLTRVNRVLASFHANQANTKQFIENAKVLYDNKDTINFALLLLMDKGYFNKIIALKKQTEQLPAPYNKLKGYFSPIRILLKDDTVTQYNGYEEKVIKELQLDQARHSIRSPESMKSFSNMQLTTNQIVGHEHELQKDQLDYRGWKCFAGIRKFMINAYGDIYGAQCKVMKLGNINTTWKFNANPITCTIRYCACLSDIQIPKYDPKYYDIPLEKLERIGRGMI